jgi:hypothetical protein
MDHTWVCACCGKQFDTLPMSYAVLAPRNWFALPEAERATRAQLSDDLCTIDNSEHYVRGCIEIPIIGATGTFVWGVWASISEQSLRRIQELWSAPIIEDEPPRFGWLSTWINGYPEPKDIRCHVHIRAGTPRPRMELEPTCYPLAIEQRTGITLDRIKEIAAASGHP